MKNEKLKMSRVESRGSRVESEKLKMKNEKKIGTISGIYCYIFAVIALVYLITLQQSNN